MKLHFKWLHLSLEILLNGEVIYDNFKREGNCLFPAKLFLLYLYTILA